MSGGLGPAGPDTKTSEESMEALRAEDGDLMVKETPRADLGLSTPTELSDDGEKGSSSCDRERTWPGICVCVVGKRPGRCCFPEVLEFDWSFVTVMTKAHRHSDAGSAGAGEAAVYPIHNICHGLEGVARVATGQAAEEGTGARCWLKRSPTRRGGGEAPKGAIRVFKIGVPERALRESAC